jgi:hypothetical protein
MNARMKLLYHFTSGFLAVFRLAKLAIFPSEKSGSANDMENLQSDWIYVGNDMRKNYV